MKVDKLKTYIGFAIKSGNVVIGYDNLFVTKKKPKLILICPSLSDKIKLKIHNFCDEKNIKYIDLINVYLKDLVSINNCKCIAILDINLAVAIIESVEMISGNEN